MSGFYTLGYRPLVLTLQGEAPLPDGDFVVIRFSDDLLTLRTLLTSYSTGQ